VVLGIETGGKPVGTLVTTSPAANGVARRWTGIEEFVREGSNARIYEGIHFRNSTEVGVAMGRRIGALAGEEILQAP
jgi:hypothetical protein